MKSIRFHLAALTLLVLVTGAVRSQCAEPTFQVDPPVARDYTTLLDEIELKVLTQHYEKALNLTYETQFETSLVAASVDRQPAGADGKRPGDTEIAARQRKLELLFKWTDQLRHQIEDKVARLKKNDDMRRAEERALQERRETKARNNPPPTPIPAASPSRSEQNPPTRF